MKNNDTCHRLIPYAFLLAASVLAAFSACRKDDATIDLRAVIADRPSGGGQKVYIDGDKYACWQNGDAVKINGDQYSVVVDPGDNRAATISNVTKNESGGYTAAYPAAYVQSCINKSVTLTMPSTQTFSSDADGQNIVAPMAGYTDDPTPDAPLRFHNVAGVLKINVKNSLSPAQDLNIYALEIESSNAYIAGTGTVDGVDTPTPSLTISSDKTKNVMLLCNNQALTSGSEAEFEIVVAPFTDPTKFTVHVLATRATDNLKYTFHRESKSGITIARNQIGSISVELVDEYIHTGEAGNYFWGQGNAECPFMITCYDDLNTLRHLVNNSGTGYTYDDTKYNRNNVHYRQTADIDISTSVAQVNNWGTSTYPVIGNTTSSSHFFQANYDGQFHTISGLNHNKQATGTPLTPLGLFGYVGQGCIKNLNVTGDFTTDQLISVGGLVGEVHLDETISNCTNHINITLARTYNTYLDPYGYGGICGIAKGGNATISYCSNHGAIKNSDACISRSMLMGGILGKNERTNTLISYCKNFGEISNIRKTENSSTSYGSMGGICGATNNNISILHCQNYGDLSTNYSSSSTSGPTILLGGILGGLTASTDNIVINIKYNRNEGDISCSTSKYISAGGCVGSLLGTYKSSNGWVTTSSSASDKSYICNINIESDTNDGNITSAGGAVYCGTGGIVGYTSGKSGSTASITTSINQSNSITSTNHQVGGIIGYSGVPTTASGLINKSTVTGTYNVGGIIGNAYSTSTISNATNTGNISGTYDVAGIAGNAYSTSTISNATNNGNISGTYNVGGIAGNVNNASSSISYAKNENAVTGTYSVGGIVGKSAGMTIDHCQNTANITSTSSNSGCGVAGIVGTGGGPTITSSKNSGKIESQSSGSYIAYVSGIIGYSSGGTYLNCANEGHIHSSRGTAYAISGIVGRASGPAKIANCYNTGNIEGNSRSNCCAGVLGSMNYSGGNTYIQNCYNVGNFITNTTNYAISGEKPAGNTYVYNCYSMEEKESFYQSASNNGGNANFNVSYELTNNAEITMYKYGTTTPISTPKIPVGSRLLNALNNWRSVNNTLEYGPFTEWIEGPKGYPVLNLDFTPPSSAKRR